MPSNKEIVREFIEAWSRLDADALVEYFTVDGVYHNMPAAPVSGHDSLKPFIAGFISNWTRTDWDILSLLEDGDIVIAERLDRTMIGDIAVDLPCCGVFEMENGKIKVWRDYFDMATYTKPLSV
ncbi:limonene-1,2-epoxide hydrolase family protein [Sphingorhabdus sp. Alg231-15]|uniref:limonene-1,2-epoxide hydrolase family protein n=1 Tax=Sphingorhabdus sp. Alg231-15 TaxID=1922222 RepID=UPI000D560781